MLTPPATARRRPAARTKAAELGGDGKDTEFEQSFSNLAHAYLQDKAPSLLQYELGFQLLDRNQDNTKAVGIFGFKIGPQLVYAPAFFLNGELKGHELLFLKDQDQFVPLKENWLNFILNKRPNVLGESVDRDPARLGITQPDLSALSQPPTKAGAAVRPELLPGAAAFAHVAATNPLADPKHAGVITLEQFLTKEGHAVIGALVRQLLAAPRLAEKLAADFGVLGVIRRALAAQPAPAAEPAGVLGKAAASAAFRIGPDGRLRRKYVPKAHQAAGVLEEVKPLKPLGGAEKGAALTVITLAAFDARADHPPEVREALLRDGVAFADKRAEEDVSTAYETAAPMTLTNPTASGVYDVLVKPGAFERCVVLVGPHTERGRKPFATVVRAGDKPAWLNTHPSRLWVRQPAETNGDAYRAWLDGLPAADSLRVSDSGLYMLVGPGGQATCPFRVEAGVAVDGPVKVYDVRFKDWADADRAGNLPLLGEAAADWDNHPLYERVTLTGKPGGLLRASGGDVFVPAGFKLLTLRADTDAERGVMCGCSGGYASDPPPVVPGTAADIRRAVFDKTAELVVARDGAGFRVGGRPLGRADALVHLVRDWGLREKQAAEIVRLAGERKAARFRVKLANPLTTGPGPVAPGFPEPPAGGDPMAAGVPTTGPQEQALPVGLPPGDPGAYAGQPQPDPQAAAAVGAAARTGQREVLDAASIGSILKAVRDDTMIDRHIGDLMRGLDRLGRILFSFYWHGEEFQERYGKQDMPELEDSLRNAFEQLGDVVLFLKQKTVEPFPEEMAHADLSAAAA